MVCVGVDKACSGCEAGLPLYSMALSTLSKENLIPVARAVALRSRLAQVLSHLSVCVSFSSHRDLCRGVLKEVRLTCLQTSVSVGIWAPLRGTATLCPFPVVCHPRFSAWAGVECLPGLSEDCGLLVTGA